MRRVRRLQQRRLRRLRVKHVPEEQVEAPKAEDLTIGALWTLSGTWEGLRRPCPGMHADAGSAQGLWRGQLKSWQAFAEAQRPHAVHAHDL